MSENNLVCQLICTRISHDIMGNIGAVANAVELLEEGDLDFLDDIKSILKISAQNLSARMKFFRMTFGLNNAGLDNIQMVRQIAEDYLLSLGNKDFPINLVFGDIAPQNRKTALLMIMVLADILIRGGELKVTENETALIAQIAADVKISTDKLEKIKSALSLGQPEVDAGLAPLQLLMQNRKINLYIDDEFIKLTAE